MFPLLCKQQKVPKQKVTISFDAAHEEVGTPELPHSIVTINFNIHPGDNPSQDELEQANAFVKGNQILLKQTECDFKSMRLVQILFEFIDTVKMLPPLLLIALLDLPLRIFAPGKPPTTEPKARYSICSLAVLFRDERCCVLLDSFSDLVVKNFVQYLVSVCNNGDSDMLLRKSCVDILDQLLNYSPKERLAPDEWASHNGNPFVISRRKQRFFE